MRKARDPAEQLVRELAREVMDLPGALQIWLLEWLRADVLALDADAHQADRLNSELKRALGAMEAVACYLRLEDKKERLVLTMGALTPLP
jgi:hypothetical protein